jgi:hypothetical protein
LLSNNEKIHELRLNRSFGWNCIQKDPMGLNLQTVRALFIENICNRYNFEVIVKPRVPNGLKTQFRQHLDGGGKSGTGLPWRESLWPIFIKLQLALCISGWS